MGNPLPSSQKTMLPSLINTTRTKIYGNPGDHVELKVFNKAGLQEKEIKFDVSLQNCPPGFVIDIKSNEMPYNTCYCSLRIYAGINCYYSEFQAIKYLEDIGLDMTEVIGNFRK